MYHPLLLQPEVLRELPALLDDRCQRVEQAAWPCYRSEAFAEDLAGNDTTLPARRPNPAVTALLWAAPMGAALCGGMVSLFVNIA